jgi:hypothetical protein
MACWLHILYYALKASRRAFKFLKQVIDALYTFFIILSSLHRNPFLLHSKEGLPKISKVLKWLIFTGMVAGAKYTFFSEKAFWSLPPNK